VLKCETFLRFAARSPSRSGLIAVAVAVAVVTALVVLVVHCPRDRGSTVYAPAMEWLYPGDHTTTSWDGYVIVMGTLDQGRVRACGRRESKLVSIEGKSFCVPRSGEPADPGASVPPGIYTPDEVTRLYTGRSDVRVVGAVRYRRARMGSDGEYRIFADPARIAFLYVFERGTPASSPGG